MDADLELHKKKFVTELGVEAWDENWGALAQLSPEFFDAVIKLKAVPRHKKHLSEKNQHLIALTVSSASTHLYAPGIQRHVTSALKAGATPAEVIEVIELTSTLGIHACNIGMPLLLEVVKEQGIYQNLPSGSKDFDPRQEVLKKEFTEKRGYWHAFWEEFLALDPELFEAYLEFSSVPWVKSVDTTGTGGALEPKMKELVYCAFDAAATHLYVPGLRMHMKNALGYNATPWEILEVLEIATQLSIHTAHAAAPVILQALQNS